MVQSVKLNSEFRIPRTERAMSETVEVAKRGQVTIPKPIRERLGIAEGQQYNVRTSEGGVLILTPRRGRASAALDRLRAHVTGQGASLEAMLAELRRLRELDG